MTNSRAESGESLDLEVPRPSRRVIAAALISLIAGFSLILFGIAAFITFAVGNGDPNTGTSNTGYVLVLATMSIAGAWLVVVAAALFRHATWPRDAALVTAGAIAAMSLVNVAIGTNLCPWVLERVAGGNTCGGSLVYPLWFLGLCFIPSGSIVWLLLRQSGRSLAESDLMDKERQEADVVGSAVMARLELQRRWLVVLSIATITGTFVAIAALQRV